MRKLIPLLLLLVSTCGTPLAAKEECPLNICKGERVIVYDEKHRRIGTIENRGYGVLQLRNEQNRRVGTIERNGTLRDDKGKRSGRVEWWSK